MRDQWIPLAEQAPPNERVLLTDGEIITETFGGVAKLMPGVTHWMPRLALPGGGQG